MQITATYTDKGGPGIKSLTGGNIAVINSPFLSPQNNTRLDGVNVMAFNNANYAILTGDSGSIEFGNINVKGITSIEISFGSQTPVTKGYMVEAYEGNVNGKKIGEVLINNTKAMQPGKAVIKAKGPISAKGMSFRIRKADPAETAVMAVSGFRLF
jgi:hypothetical protein